MWRRLLEYWEVPYFNKMVSFNEDRNAYDWVADAYDDADVVYYRKGKFRRSKGGMFEPPKECFEVYQDYLRERARRKEEHDNWLDRKMSLEVSRTIRDATKKVSITYQPKVWRRIRQLAKKYDKTVDEVIAIACEAFVRRFVDFE